MTIKIDNNNDNKIIVIPTFKKEDKIKFFDNSFDKNIINTAIELNYKNKKDEIIYFKFKEKIIIFLGLNKENSSENLRNAYSKLFYFLKAKEFNEVQINFPSKVPQEIKAIIEGLGLSNYEFNKYISKNKKIKNKLKLFLNISKTNKELVNKTLIINQNVKLCRDLVNENADLMTPKAIEIISKKIAKENNLKIKVLNEKQIIKEELNLINAVGKGSDNPPRLIILEYKGDKKSPNKTALVGKGVTFDTGGLNLKPTNYIENMKMDMGGAATAFSVFKSAVELKLQKNLILVLGCAENAISSKAYKPGDIIQSYNKTNIEILNTDAEGRLVLADSLSYVQKNYKPTEIIDIATLTGACLVALGPTLIAMLGNNNKIKQNLFKSGEKTFDRVWELPIYDEHREMIKSKIADIKNIGNKFGGTITAAAFLEKFIEKDINWTHLDIAGAAYDEIPSQQNYMPLYATGRGVRLLIEYLSNN